MIDFLAHAWWLILVLGILITFHEFGHFWVARLMGVKVLRFSVGFGKPLISRTDKDDTEFVVAALPLGGYVKMLDEREAPVARHELDLAFNRKPLGARTAIVAAGPIFNLIFAIFAFWLMFMIGVEEPKPIVGTPTALAADAGILAGDEIIAVEDRQIENWTHVLLALIGPALDGEQVTIRLEDTDGNIKQRRLDFAELGEKVDEPRLLSQIGLNPWRATFTYSNELGVITAGLPAETAGLQVGDTVISIAGQQVNNWTDIVTVLDRFATPDIPLTIGYLRDGRSYLMDLVPVSVTTDNGRQRTQIGIGPSPLSEQEEARQRAELEAQLEENSFIWRHGPISAISASFNELWQFTTGTLGMLGRMITGRASLENLSGPITIASLAKQSAELGLTTFLRLLALISLSLAILNLLPIPLLDGGLLMYYLIEWLTGKPVSENIQMIGQGIGVLMLACLMGLAFYNDIARLVS